MARSAQTPAWLCVCAGCCSALPSPVFTPGQAQDHAKCVCGTTTAPSLHRPRVSAGGRLLCLILASLAWGKRFYPRSSTMCHQHLT